MPLTEILIRMDRAIIDAIDVDAHKRGISRAAVIRLAAARWLARVGQSHKKKVAK
jgi:hypothetical protein